MIPAKTQFTISLTTNSKIIHFEKYWIFGIPYSFPNLVFTIDKLVSGSSECFLVNSDVSKLIVMFPTYVSQWTLTRKVFVILSPPKRIVIYIKSKTYFNFSLLDQGSFESNFFPLYWWRFRGDSRTSHPKIPIHVSVFEPVTLVVHLTVK